MDLGCAYLPFEPPLIETNTIVLEYTQSEYVQISGFHLAAGPRRPAAQQEGLVPNWEFRWRTTLS